MRIAFSFRTDSSKSSDGCVLSSLRFISIYVHHSSPVPAENTIYVSFFTLQNRGQILLTIKTFNIK